MDEEPDPPDDETDESVDSSGSRPSDADASDRTGGETPTDEGDATPSDAEAPDEEGEDGGPEGTPPPVDDAPGSESWGEGPVDPRPDAPDAERPGEGADAGGAPDEASRDAFGPAEESGHDPETDPVTGIDEEYYREAGTESVEDAEHDGGEPGRPAEGIDDYMPGGATMDEEIDTVGEYIDEPEGPTADDEMPLTAHVEEMFKRVMAVVAVAGVVSVATYPFSVEIINFLWNSILSATTRPRLYSPLEPLLTQLKVASLAGIIVGLPVLVYQTYQFMKPGLYPHERRYYLAAVPTSLVLALLGVSFAYFVVLPAVFLYFLNYSEGVAVIGFALGRTFNLILGLMGYLAIVFQIPLLIMLAMMMGVVTRQWLADRRLLFWGGFLGVSFVMFGPADPTGATPFLVTLTMILLFEGTLFLAKWTRRARERSSS